MILFLAILTVSTQSYIFVQGLINEGLIHKNILRFSYPILKNLTFHIFRLDLDLNNDTTGSMQDDYSEVIRAMQNLHPHPDKEDVSNIL